MHVKVWKDFFKEHDFFLMIYSVSFIFFDFYPFKTVTTQPHSLITLAETQLYVIKSVNDFFDVIMSVMSVFLHQII